MTALAVVNMFFHARVRRSALAGSRARIGIGPSSEGSSDMHLTRNRIEEFAALARRLPVHWECAPIWMQSAGLIREVHYNSTALTPAGEDLLATVPHLPKPEPVTTPVCERCGGLGEEPLFMGPMMVPCPKCRPPKATVVIKIGDKLWVRVDSDALRDRFDGRLVELSALSGVDRQGQPFDQHPKHGHVGLCSWGSWASFFIDDAAVSWDSRGNVYLRLVSE